MKKPEERGERYLAFARALDRPTRLRPTAKAVAAVRRSRFARPRSASRGSRPCGATLTRSTPSSFSGLKALDPVERDTRAARSGRMHGTRAYRNSREISLRHPPARGARTLSSIARARFAPLQRRSGLRRPNWPNIEKGLDFVLDFERKSRGDICAFGSSGGAKSSGSAGERRVVQLTARADRIDVMLRAARGSSTTRAERRRPPRRSKSDLRRNSPWKPKCCGAEDSTGCPRSTPRRRSISSLAGAAGGEEKHAGGKDENILALAERHFAGLQMLLDAFACEETPYLSRPFPKFVPRFSDYDHLARVKEWSATGGECDSGDAP